MHPAGDGQDGCGGTLPRSPGRRPTSRRHPAGHLWSGRSGADTAKHVYRRRAPVADSTAYSNKENFSENEATLLDRSALHISAKGKKKSAGFNLRKSIAWNPAFFTEEGVLDTSELSVLTGSELMPDGSPSTAIDGIVSPLCHPGRYHNTHALKKVAEKSPGKLPAKYSRTENQGRRLFSSAKTPQRDEPSEPAEIQNRNSARSLQKHIPRVAAAAAGSTQKKVPNSTSTALMSRIPKKPLPSVPMAPRSITPATTVSKSSKKLAAGKTEYIHGAPGLLPRSKIDSRPSMETDVVPAVASIRNETIASVKLKNPQISPSSFGGPTSAIAKPSALRMPSPSVGFFTQENAQTSHGHTAERNVGRPSAASTSLLVRPPRCKLPEDFRVGHHLSNVQSTNCTTASNLVSLPITTDSNTNTLGSSEKRSVSKIISTYSTKSKDASYQEKTEVYCSLTESGATKQPLSSENNDGAGNNMRIAYKDMSRVEGRGIIKEIEPVEISLSPKASCFCFSTIEATCSSTKPTVGSKSSPSCTSSQRNDPSCQSKTDSGSIAAKDLGNSHVGERALPVSLCDDESCSQDIGSFQTCDSCGNHSNEHAILMESVDALYADHMAPSSTSNGKPALDDTNLVSLNNSLYDEGKSALSEEPNTDIGTKIVTKDPLLHVGCEQSNSCKRTKCSPVKPEARMTCVESQNVLSVELSMEDKMELGSNKLGASHREKDKGVDRSRTNTILKDHLKNLVPFTEEWLAVMEACGQEVLEQKSGAVQNSPPDKTAPEPSPWSPVKRKAQDVGPFDCTKYSKSVRTSGTP